MLSDSRIPFSQILRRRTVPQVKLVIAEALWTPSLHIGRFAAAGCSV
jgi:hypothetical protein